MNNIIRSIILITGIFIPAYGYAVILPGLFDEAGNPVHTADEFTLSVTADITKVTQGYQYRYSLHSSPSSTQDVWAFKVKLPAVDGVVLNSTTSPWGIGGYPKAIDPLRGNYFPNFSYTPEMLFVGWAFPPIKGDPRFLVPSGLVSGFTFISLYPPGISFAYAEGLTGEPAFDVEPNSEDVSLPFDKHTPYGPGKIIPVIGPVKPTTPNVTDNYSVIGCAGGICDVQLDITGPQDPYGNVYSYQWTGAFGSAVGAKPIVQLAAGMYNVSVAVSDPYATLVTATMPISVVDPNPPVVVPLVAGAALTPAQVAALTPAQVAALTPTQVSSIITLLSPAQIALLAPNQLVALSLVQVQAVSALLTPAQLSAASTSMTDEDGEHSSDNNSDDEPDEDDKSS